jgi:hypothetical protein
LKYTPGTLQHRTLADRRGRVGVARVLAGQATTTLPLTPEVVTLTPRSLAAHHRQALCPSDDIGDDCACAGKVMVAGVNSFIVANVASTPSSTMVKVTSTNVKPGAVRRDPLGLRMAHETPLQQATRPSRSKHHEP